MQASSSWNLFPVLNEVNGGFRNLEGRTVKLKPVTHEREGWGGGNQLTSSSSTATMKI